MNARNVINSRDVDKIIHDRLFLQRVERLRIIHQNNELNSSCANTQQNLSGEREYDLIKEFCVDPGTSTGMEEEEVDFLDFFS